MLVSVVVPCYNSRNFVGDALDSVFAQTHHELELICVDDGSSDGTGDVLDEIRSGAAIPMRVIRLQTNAGACAARNAGLEVAQGDYVQFLDSDDLLHPDKVAHQIDLIDEEPGRVDLVTADSIWHTRSGKKFVREVDRRPPFFGLVGSRLGITTANLWRTRMLRDVDGFDIHMRTSNEYDLMFRMLKAGARTLLDPSPKTVVRHRSGSLSRSDSRDVIMRFIRLRLDMLEYADRQGVGGSELRQLGYDLIFKKARLLWRYDRPAAESVYADVLPRHFLPSPDLASSSYRLLLRTLGFPRAQRVGSVLGRFPPISEEDLR